MAVSKPNTSPPELSPMLDTYLTAENETSSAIECDALSKSFTVFDDGTVWKLLVTGKSPGRNFEALREVSLTVPKGQFVGLLGRNGAGKSTLLRTIGGVYAPTEGIIRVNGPPSGIYELGIAGSPFLSGRQFAQRCLSFASLDADEIDKLLPDILSFSELGDYFEKPVLTYSTGMKARLNFAVATALPGKIYLIDEVLSVGDELFQSKCWRRLRERLEDGASGLLATHDWSAVLKLCQTAHVLEKGRLVDYGASRDVVRRYLNLSQPSSRIARFGPDLQQVFQVQGGVDAMLQVPVHVFQDVPIQFGCSVEYFRYGYSWEHLLHVEMVEIARQAGQYVLDLSLLKLPLPQGEYSLNLFLSSLGGDRETFDVRSWTYNNDLTLSVRGRPRNSVLALPFQWRLDKKLS